MSMLQAVLDADSQKLESLIMKHPNHINFSVGLPFEVHGGRFFNHPAITQCVILQHPDQTIFDIACALPSGPIIWILLAHGAKGTKHPFGTDLAFHNAIKNGRTYTVQALLMPGRSKINGEPGVVWKPLIQAVYWNHPDIVRLLIDRGASVNESALWLDGVEKSALQYCLHRRLQDYRNLSIREKCGKIIKMLLNAGADILAQPNKGNAPIAFETFVQPWQGDPHWIEKLSPDEMECLEAFVRMGSDLKFGFDGFACTAPSGRTFEHQVLWHSTPVAARLLIDHAAPNPDGNGSGLLHEIVGSCPDAKRHPSDTLRDIEVLFKRGADPNLVDGSSFTPLRHCIERCPAVDIVPRLRMLLDGGADPELKHSNRLPPFVLAARTFEEPLRSQVMDFLVAKIRGRQPRVVYDDAFHWTEGYFPIPDAPTFAQVQLYNGQNGDFNANVDQMLPEDVRTAFRRACFSVVSMNYLNAATTRAKMHQPLQMLASEKDEMFQVALQRQIAGLPEYRFDLEFVMGLLKPQMAPVLANFTAGLGNAGSSVTEPDDILLPYQTPILSSAPTSLSTLATCGDSSSSLAMVNFAQTSKFPLHTDADPNANSSQGHRPRRVSISSTLSTSSDDSTGSHIPTTTLVRWSAIGEPTRQTHIKRSKDAVLRYTCKDCSGGNLLTKAELERHRVEHEHTRGCLKAGCRRRFCAGRA
ncbi:ankyrin [Lentithecium fluviatile CBS 122367]|uniref:Ankyrin n=1 Tax=Lentithecium fluviatile CBS 122367 TaxID=1168545 RepID=A0A6G1J7A8_9PLEO|nr:ankyrin [Lentithecium fluviatile CBS 122367]